MKRSSTVFLQLVIALVGAAALALLLRLPLTEGRAANLDLFHIYFDPFILYGYLASILFFVALYQAFKLLGYIGQNKLFSQNSATALRTIKYCAITLSVLIVIAGLYIRIFHAEGDDPAGFLALCIAAILISIAVAVAAAKFERLLRKAIDIKSEK